MTPRHRRFAFLVGDGMCCTAAWLYQGCTTACLKRINKQRSAPALRSIQDSHYAVPAYIWGVGNTNQANKGSNDGLLCDI